MKKAIPISIVIVTKNRYLDLAQCVSSILYQKKIFSELIVINNNSSDYTLQCIDNLSKKTTQKIKLITDKSEGYPQIYNRGLKEAHSEWVIFIDDDCVALPEWLETIEMAIKRYPDTAAFLGQSKTYFSKNAYSVLTNALSNYWKSASISRNNSINNLEILDNKNIIYNKNFLNKKNISFNEKRSVFLNGSSEDCELGHQIMVNHGHALYLPNMLVYHKDPTNFSYFIKKLLRSYLGYLAFKKQSKVSMYKIRVQTKTNFFSYLINYPEFLQFNNAQKILTIALYIFSNFLLKLTGIYFLFFYNSKIKVV